MDTNIYSTPSKIESFIETAKKQSKTTEGKELTNRYLSMINYLKNSFLKGEINANQLSTLKDYATNLYLKGHIAIFVQNKIDNLFGQCFKNLEKIIQLK